MKENSIVLSHGQANSMPYQACFGPSERERVNGCSAAREYKFEPGAGSEWLVREGTLEVWRGPTEGSNQILLKNLKHVAEVTTPNSPDTLHRNMSLDLAPRADDQKTSICTSIGINKSNPKPCPQRPCHQNTVLTTPLIRYHISPREIGPYLQVRC